MAAWNAALEDGGWLSTVDGVRADLDRGGPGPSVAAPPPPPANGRPGRLDHVLNEVLTAFDNVDEVAGRSAITAQGSGVSGYHKLALRLSRAGLVGCEVDAAWASQQSEPIGSRDELEARVAEMAARFAGGEVPLPPSWGGYRLEPETYEFWEHRDDRLHDRLRYTQNEQGRWRMERLAP